MYIYIYIYFSFCRNEISRRGKVICRICEDFIIFNVEYRRT